MNFIKIVNPKTWLALRKRLMVLEKRMEVIEKNFQALMRLSNASVAGNSDWRTQFCNREYQCFSQHGEDGLLLYLFSKIGKTNQRFIEFGIGNGQECNTANLSLNFGWNGLLMEADPAMAARAQNFYEEKTGGKSARVKVVQCKVLSDNINKMFTQNGMQGEIDLLSIDIDSNDYWIWKAIEAVTPRVVVIEYNAFLGAEKAITVQYDMAFNRFKKHPSGLYYGASLGALAHLGQEKGYRLVGCESHGVNAFFVRKDIAEEHFPEISVPKAYYEYYPGKTDEMFNYIKHLDFVTV